VKLRSLELVATQQASSGEAPEFAALQQASSGEASELGACCNAARKLRRSSEAPELALQQNAYLGKKNEHCDFKKMFTWVLRGSGSSRSKLVPAPSRSKPLQAPSSLPFNVSGARSSGDGVRGEGLVGGR
jgi:hypothetical protein